MIKRLVVFTALIFSLSNLSATVISDLPSPSGSYLSALNERFKDPAKLQAMLVVLADVYGNESFSYVVFRERDNFLQAVYIQNELPSGVYQILATSENKFQNQRLFVK